MPGRTRATRSPTRIRPASPSEGHHRQIRHHTDLYGDDAPQRQWPALPKVATDVPHQKAIHNAHTLTAA